MDPVEYPQKKCREPLFNSSGMGYTCDVVLMHPGPCASFSVKTSVERRDAWELAHPEWRQDIGQDIEV